MSLTAKGIPDTLRHTVFEVAQGDISAVERVLAESPGRVAALARDHGTLLAVDEVITFRLEYGGLHTRYGIIPDLVSLGKVIGGGYPVGAVGGSAAVLSSFSPLTDGPVA